MHDDDDLVYVYVAGPYTGRHHDHRSYFEIDRNITDATEMCALLAKHGYAFFNPHSHSAHFESITPEVKPAYWYKLDMHFLRVCDALLMLPTWGRSSGARAERDWAVANGVPVFYSLDELLEKMPPNSKKTGGG